MTLYDAAVALICFGLPYLFYRHLEREAGERRAIEARLDAVIRGGR